MSIQLAFLSATTCVPAVQVSLGRGLWPPGTLLGGWEQVVRLLTCTIWGVYTVQLISKTSCHGFVTAFSEVNRVGAEELEQLVGLGLRGVHDSHQYCRVEDLFRFSLLV